MRKKVKAVIVIDNEIGLDSREFSGNDVFLGIPKNS